MGWRCASDNSEEGVLAVNTPEAGILPPAFLLGLPQCWMDWVSYKREEAGKNALKKPPLQY